MKLPPHWLVFLLGVLSFGACNEFLVVFWGEPSIYSLNYTTVSVIDWDDCVYYCKTSIHCVLAAGNDSSCDIYDYGTVTEVVELTEMDGQKVAMKRNLTEGVCTVDQPKSTSYLTVDDPTYPYTIFAYTITYVSFGYYTIEYNVTRLCPPDWKMYSRPLSNFCLKLFGGPNITFTQAQATEYCDDENATLAGLETLSEKNDMTAQGRAINLVDARGLVYSGFWVSGIRKSSCSTLAQVATAACNSTKAFDFTDKYISTLSGYVWAPANPDGVSATGPYQDCIMLRTSTNVTVMLGVVDDVQCTYSVGSAFDIHGYVCGKIPGI